MSPHILYDFYIGNEAAREEAELKEAARYFQSNLMPAMAQYSTKLKSGLS